MSSLSSMSGPTTGVAIRKRYRGQEASGDAAASGRCCDRARQWRGDPRRISQFMLVRGRPGSRPISEGVDSVAARGQTDPGEQRHRSPRVGSRGDRAPRHLQAPIAPPITSCNALGPVKPGGSGTRSRAAHHPRQHAEQHCSWVLAEGCRRARAAWVEGVTPYRPARKSRRRSGDRAVD